ncbi:hypothetical protein CP532_5844 [Ophiocordyceps camponoti-leonardi (nom. inval.)]|nr:hypothetical protein CP532_5844 [Ophiocordyceps camponoti-leonardi (nom. inval.)]
MTLQNWLFRIIMYYEILRRPGFHRAVGRIHRAIDERIHGRNPHEPLAQGEATADPTRISRRRLFFRHFFDELRNQARGKPTDPPAK